MTMSTLNLHRGLNNMTHKLQQSPFQTATRWLMLVGFTLAAGACVSGGGGGPGGVIVAADGSPPDSGQSTGERSDAAQADGGACAPFCFSPCGDDGCGGACNRCPEGETCGVDGQCAPIPASCGDDTCDPEEDCAVCVDDCGECCGNGTCEEHESCGTCLADCGCRPDETCNAETERCIPIGCTPQCDGRACGPNGCGDVCGQCDGDELCSGEGICVDASACGEQPCEVAWSTRCANDGGGYVQCIPNPEDPACLAESRRITCNDGRMCSAASGRCAGPASGVQLMLLIDRTRSMEGDGWAAITVGLQRFLDRLGPWHRVGVRLFPAEGCTASAPLPPQPNALERIEAELEAAPPGLEDQTPIAAAFADVGPLFGDYNEGQAVVLITDGTETCAETDAPLLAAVTGLRRRGIATFAIGIGRRADGEFLQRLADQAGTRTGDGEGFSRVDDADEVASALEAIFAWLDGRECDDGVGCNEQVEMQCADGRVTDRVDCASVCAPDLGCVDCWPPEITRCANDTHQQTCSARGQWEETTDCIWCLEGACVPCVPGTTRCVDARQLETCGPDGRWGGREACTHCLDGACVACAPGARRCAADNRLERCGPEGAWGAGQACDFCLNNACVDCEPGALQCADATHIDRCNAGGHWVAHRACAHCLNGECVLCAPDTTQCLDETQLQRCTQNGTWAPDQDCGFCLNGACTECVPHEVECLDDTHVRTCGLDGEWRVDPCIVCIEGRCQECVGGDTECVDDTHGRQCSAEGQWLPPQECERCEDAQCRFNTELGTIRLVDGHRPSEGRVEIRHNNEWGAVCSGNFTARSAQVVCRQLGLPTTGAHVRYGRPFGRHEGRDWLRLISCNGDEAEIEACRHGGWGDAHCNGAAAQVVCTEGECRAGDTLCVDDTHLKTCGENDQWEPAIECPYCLHDSSNYRSSTRDYYYHYSGACVDCRTGDTRCLDEEQTQVCGADNTWDDGPICSDGCVDGGCAGDGEVRLVDGQRPGEGRVDVRHNDEWGAVCSGNFTARSAQVVCRQLGLPTTGAHVRYGRPFGRHEGRDWIRLISCNGDETELSACRHAEWGEVNCNGAAAQVVCIEGECRAGDTLCVDDTHLKTCGENDQWEPAIECPYCLHDSSNYRSSTRDYYYHYSGACVDCRTGDTRCLDEEQTQVCGADNTWDDGPICSDGCVDGGCAGDGEVRLVDGQRPGEGRVDVRHNDEWGAVCSGNFTARSAQVVCRQLGLPTTGAHVRYGRPFGRHEGRDWVRLISCSGDEAELSACRHAEWGEVNCNGASAQVVCTDGECRTDDTLCTDDTHLKTCGENDQWEPSIECAFCLHDSSNYRSSTRDYYYHYTGACVDCREGDTRCLDAQRVEVCGEDNQWGAEVVNCPAGCVGDRCVDG